MIKVAITWCPAPKALIGRPAWETYLNLTVDVISKLRSCCESFSVFPEFDTKGRLHFHGTLFVKDYRYYYRTVLPMMRKIGFVMEKKTKIDESWEEYIRKDYHIMKPVMDPLPVPITEQTYVVTGRYSKKKLLQKLLQAQKRKKDYMTVLNYMYTEAELEKVRSAPPFVPQKFLQF